MPMQKRQKTDILHYTIAIGVYGVILVTEEDAILGAVGMVSGISLAFLSIRRATQGVDNKTLVYWLASVMWILTSLCFMLVLPLYWLIYSVVKYSVIDMTLVSVATFCCAFVYYGVAFLAHVARACMKVCSPGDNVTVVIRIDETSGLLGCRSNISASRHLQNTVGRYSTHPVVVVASGATDLSHLETTSSDTKDLQRGLESNPDK